jgi:hypothetical protein
MTKKIIASLGMIAITKPSITRVLLSTRLVAPKPTSEGGFGALLIQQFPAVSKRLEHLEKL